eukprot:3050608-Rhodomonas_salina.1
MHTDTHRHRFLCDPSEVACCAVRGAERGGAGLRGEHIKANIMRKGQIGTRSATSLRALR